MLMQRYYVVYVEVPTGYPGVEAVDVPIADISSDVKATLREAIWNSRTYAVLDILEGR